MLVFTPFKLTHNLVDTIIILLLSKDMIVSGYDSCWGTNVCGHKRVWVQSCMCTIMWAQSCLGTNVCGHKRLWARKCLCTTVCGHKRFWAQNVCGHSHVVTIVWAQSCMGTNVVELSKPISSNPQQPKIHTQERENRSPTRRGTLTNTLQHIHCRSPDTNITIVTYADDTTILSSHANPHITKQQVQP